uniref:DUF4371 domain-containing protein n=1 Tax=Latimeria chalumnae TaxID=7897 RepID=H3A3T1_LATCH
LFKRMFPDSAIVQKYACKRSKTTMIMNSVMATKFIEEPLKDAQEGPFTLCLDSSSDTEDKLFPILRRFCQGATGEIKVGLLDLPVLTVGTVDDLISCIDQIFQQMKIPWQNCVGFSCDNISVNVGRHRSLKVHIENRAPKLYTLNCPCHLISLCALKAASSLLVNGDEVLIRVFYYLDKSARWKHLLKEHAEFVNVEHRKILKHRHARWLSIGKRIDRILMIMPTLRLFFQSEDLEKKRQNRDVCDFVCSPKTELYLLFISSAIAVFEDVNKVLQYEAPIIPMVHGSLMELLRKVMIEFIRTEVLTEASSLLATDYSDVNNQVPNRDLFIGFATKQYLLRTVELTESQITVLYSNLRNFYPTAVKYIVKKFPLNYPILTF